MHVMYFEKKIVCVQDIWKYLWIQYIKGKTKNLIVNNAVSIDSIYDSVIAVSCVIF